MPSKFPFHTLAVNFPGSSVHYSSCIFDRVLFHVLTTLSVKTEREREREKKKERRKGREGGRKKKGKKTKAKERFQGEFMVV